MRGECLPLVNACVGGEGVVRWGDGGDGVGEVGERYCDVAGVISREVGIGGGGMREVSGRAD